MLDEQVDDSLNVDLPDRRFSESTRGKAAGIHSRPSARRPLRRYRTGRRPGSGRHLASTATSRSCPPASLRTSRSVRMPTSRPWRQTRTEPRRCLLEKPQNLADGGFRAQRIAAAGCPLGRIGSPFRFVRAWRHCSPPLGKETLVAARNYFNHSRLRSEARNPCRSCRNVSARTGFGNCLAAAAAIGRHPLMGTLWRVSSGAGHVSTANGARGRVVRPCPAAGNDRADTHTPGTATA